MTRESSREEWSIQDTETGDVLGSIGGREITEERLRSLIDDSGTRYCLVRRIVTYTPWTKAPHAR